MISTRNDKTQRPGLYHIFVLLFFLIVPLIPLESLAGSEQEIGHLLSSIELSGCTFIRNGKKYSAAEAREHIQNKYEHAKSRIQTAEDFIQYAATKSSMTGEPYKIRCDGNEAYTVDWLRSVLLTFRRR